MASDPDLGFAGGYSSGTGIYNKKQAIKEDLITFFTGSEWREHKEDFMSGFDTEEMGEKAAAAVERRLEISGGRYGYWVDEFGLFTGESKEIGKRLFGYADENEIGYTGLLGGGTGMARTGPQFSRAARTMTIDELAEHIDEKLDLNEERIIQQMALNYISLGEEIPANLIALAEDRDIDLKLPKSE